MAKDFNDILVQNGKINTLPLEDIDIYVAKNIISHHADDIPAQYKAIEKYYKTIKSPLIRSDLAKILAQKWDKKIDELKEFLEVSTVSADEILDEFKDAYVCIKEMEDSILNHEGITTGYPTFDASIGGLSLQDVFFVAARPGIGKTFIAMEMALHMAIRLKLNVLFFSLEMPAAKLYVRLIANILGISVTELKDKIKNKTINYEDILEKLKKKIQVNDKPYLTIDQIEERIQLANTYNIFSEGKTQVVIIDYVQMMPKMSNFEYFEEKVMYFKPLARKNNILLIPLSQMARTTKSWEEADVSNMKGGGALEQVGDTIWLLWKTSESPKLSATDRKIMEEKGQDNIIDSKIGKARNGIDGARYIRLCANKETTSIKELIE